MRVLYVSKALVVSAYRSKVRELARELEVTSVVPARWGPDRPEASPAGVPEPLRVPVRLHGHNHLHFYRRPRAWLDRADLDLVHVDEEPYSLVTFQLARLCRRRGIPFVFFAWQNLPKRLPPPFDALRRWVYRRAAGGIAGSEGAARVLDASGYGGPLAVIPQFGVDPEVFAPAPEAGRRVRTRLGIPPDAFVVGYCGRLVREKGLDVLVRAWGAMDGEGEAAGPWLMLVGEGPEGEDVRRRAEEGGLGGRMRLTGRCASLEVPRHLAAMDVLILPSVGSSSWTEQFGRVLVEAMACGVPVVGSRCGEIPLVVGDAGEIVPSGDAGALTGALERLRDDPDLRRRRAEAGRRRVLERFTQERIAADTAAFYRTVLQRERAA